MAGINFTVGVDGSQYFAGMKNMEAQGKSTAKAIQDAFGQKLKSVLSITAIEEGVRRTGEWAAEIDRVSKNLGVTREQLQTIQLISSKTGTSESAVVGMFENINKARDEALRGNHELIQSFQRVGITYDDLLNQTRQGLFSKVVGGINPSSKNEMMRTAIQNITGTPEGVIAGFQSGMGGKSFSEIQQAGVASGSIVKEEQVQGISAQWAAVLTSFKDAGAQLIPIAGALLDLTKLLADGLGGVAEFIRYSFEGVVKLLQGDWSGVGKSLDSIGKLLFSFTVGVAKVIAMSIDFLWNLIRKIPGMKKLMPEIAVTAELEEMQKGWNKSMGINTETARRGGAAGEVVGMVATPQAITKVGNKITGKILDKYEKNALYKMDMEKVTTRPKEGMYTKIGKDYFKLSPELETQLRDLQKQGKLPGVTDTGKVAYIKNEILAEDVNAIRNMKTKIKSIANTTTTGLAGSEAASTVGRTLAISKEEREKALANSIIAGEAKPILPMWGLSGIGGAPLQGGAMLKLGGMFGSGDNKIVKLNVEMVKLLNMIQVNTSPYGKAGAASVNINTGNNMGGASGGM